MNKEKVYLSKEKLQELKEEIEELKMVRRKEIAEKLEYAKSLGDLSENAEYQEACEAQAAVEERISTIELLLKSAIVISGGRTDVASIGSIVTVQKVGDSGKKQYTLVGSEEANVSEGKISNKSPFGEAMFGKKKGEEFVSKSPVGNITYKIITIE